MRERLAILAEQERLSLSDAGICHIHSIQATQLRRWRNSIEQIQNAGTRRASLHVGRRPDFAEFEDDLLQYVLDRRRSRAIVTVRNLADAMLQMIPRGRHKTFKQTRRWIYRFLARKRLSIRRITRNISLPEVELQRRADIFLTEVQCILTAEPSTIFINMDQTAVYQDMMPRSTIDSIGITSVSTITANTSERVTAVLCVCSNGEKLRPMIIFKGSETGRIAWRIHARNTPFPPEAVYAVQANAWMDQRIMIEWLELVLFPYVDALIQGGRRIVLVLDTLRVHRTPEVMRRIHGKMLRIIFVPGGLTGQLQPMDVGINGPLKHWLREMTAHEEPNNQVTTEQRRIRIAGRVLSCWNSLDSELVINSFNHMFIRSVQEVDDFDEIQ
jgi:hypothetical protein